MQHTPIASLVPGRVAGTIETEPTRSGHGKVLLLRQAQLGAVTAPPAGVVLAEAAPFSHGLIRWLGRSIPLGLLAAGQADAWQQGTAVVLDTAAGELSAALPGEQLAPWRPPPAPAAGEPICTADSNEVALCASVADDAGVGRAIACGAASIGLVRSELLLPDGDAQPDAELYRRALSRLLALAGPLNLTVRLLDLATDKWPVWLAAAGAGTVLYKRHGSQLFGVPVVHDVTAAQLEALAAIGDRRLRVIWPSGARLADFKRWRDDARRTLPAGIALGAMVETPLELLALRRWLRAADFVAIGCNDLLAHLCGADRGDPAQRLLLDPYRPELFRFLGDAAAAAGADLGRVELCGLLAQIEGLLPVLVGLGYRRYSVEPTLIPLLAETLANTTLDHCRARAGAVCACETVAKVRALLGVRSEVPWGLVRS